MTLLNDAIQDKKFDVRMMDKNMSRGEVTADDVQKAVKSLPDDAANAEFISVETLMAQALEQKRG